MSTTARELARRLWTLLALCVAATAALFGAYQGVHTDAVPLSTRSAPAVLAVDTAKDALTQAKDDAVRGAAGNGDFQTRISVAEQSLALAASDNVTSLKGRQALQTVTGLIAVYTGMVEQADEEPSGSALRTAYLGYAASVLDNRQTPQAGVMGRLDQLQSDQLATLSGQSSFGWPLWLGCGAVAVLGLALVVALVEVQRYSRRRFRRRWNRPLAAATVLLAAGTAVLGRFTWQTHSGMAQARARLAPPLAGDAIQRAGAAVARCMAGTDFRAAVADWIPIGGAALMVLIVAGLMPRIADYRFRGSR